MKKILVKVEPWFSRLRHNGFFQASIGFLFFLLIAAVLMFSIESSQRDTSFSSFFQSLWFTIVTVTTVGYGDMSPFSTVGKLAAVAIMFVGIGYSGILTGNITSWLVEKNRQKALGLVPLKNKLDHFVIFGWRSDLAILLINILKQQNLTSKQLVLVNNIDINKINDLKQNPELRDLYFFRGDYTNTKVLHNICINTAQKALILANEESGQSADEIDFKTVLAAKAVERLNPNIFTIAEIIQPEFESPLSKSHVEETITNRNTCRSLISNMALMSGLHQVIRTIFRINSGLIKTKQISLSHVKKSFADIIQIHDDILIIGILENSGNLDLLKKEKMQEIQKSVSIQLAIQNLIEIKNMQSNLPIINPAPNYTINENSSLIYLEADPDAINSWYLERVKKVDDKGTLNNQQFLTSKLLDIVPKHKYYKYLFEDLQQIEIELYEYNDTADGVIYKNKKYAFEILQLEKKIIDSINVLFQSKSHVLSEEQSTLTDQQLAEHEALDEILADYHEEKILKPIKNQYPGDVLLICGWKNHLSDMIKLILKQHDSEETEWDQIVVVADINFDSANIFNDHFKDEERVKLIRGDFVNQNVLIQANIKKATKIMILAEVDSKRSYQEIDARTVLTAMSLNDLNKRAYKIIEVLNHKYEETLKYSGIEEIVPLDEIYQIMLTNGTHGKGLTNIMSTIINLENKLFKLAPIKSKYINKPFSELLSDIDGLNQLVIGVVEETGNTYVRKANVIKRAQLEPKIMDSVVELKKVKGITANQVVICPGKDYRVKPYSKLILLGSSDYKGWLAYNERFNLQ